MAVNYVLPCPTSGRPLTTFEDAELCKINALLWPALVGFNSIGAINATVPVKLEDKRTIKRKVHIDFERLKDIEANLKERIRDVYNKAKGNKDNAKKASDISDDEIKEMLDYLKNADNVKVDKETIQKLDQEWNELNKTKQDLAKRGITTSGDHYIDIDLLGEYKGSHIILYTGNIDKYSGGKPDLLISTYVHEMMHAYYKTSNTISEAEEAIVEYSMLCFLEAFDKRNGTSYFTSALQDVKEKQSIPTSHYGFGAYLFEHRDAYMDWIDVYKKFGSCIHSHPLVGIYKKYLNGVYPFSNEENIKNLLYGILTNTANLDNILNLFRIDHTLKIANSTAENYSTYIRAIQDELNKNHFGTRLLEGWILNPRKDCIYEFDHFFNSNTGIGIYNKSSCRTALRNFDNFVKSI